MSLSIQSLLCGDDENQGVAALLLSWEGESSARSNVLEVQRVFENEYRFYTQTFEIPTVENPITKLAASLDAFLEKANQSRLLIIYYTGYGLLDSSMQLCWARSAQHRSFRLKWAAICLCLEYTRADISFLLDTYFKFETIPSSHGLRQVTAAGQQTAPDSSNFTKCLVQALHNIHKSPTFFTGQLFADMTAIAKANNSSSFMITPDTNNGRQDANLVSPPRVLPSEYKNSYPSSDSNLASRYLGYGSDSESGHTKGQVQSMAASRLNGRDRKVPCPFSFAGCNSESRRRHLWQQHAENVHLRFKVYNCSSCYEKGNFKQFFHNKSFRRHLREVHKYSAQYAEQCVEECRQTYRQPPQAMSCPAKECVKVFRGIGAWVHWARHVWSHRMSEDEIAECDTSLVNYAVTEGIIKQGSNGKYILCRQLKL